MDCSCRVVRSEPSWGGISFVRRVWLSNRNERVSEVSPLGKIAKILKLVLLGLAVLYLVAYVAIAMARIAYPFELEWREGGAVDHIVRILAGEKLYVQPSVAFVPYTYTPLFFYVSAGVAKVLGVGFTPLRLVSFVSSLGSLLVIYLLVKRETRAIYYGVLSAGLFAATFRAAGAWFDIARVDSLFLVLCLATVYLVRAESSRLGYACAGVLMALAFLAKQTALPVCLPLLVYAIIFRRRLALYLLGAAGLLIPASTIILNHLHDGWYYYYVFVSPRQHAIVSEMFVGFWTSDMLILFVAFAFAAAYLILAYREGSRQNAVFYALLLGGGVGASWFSRLSNGGYNNVLMPAYATLSVLFGLGLHKSLGFMQIVPERKRFVATTYVFLLCIIQFASLRYDPVAQVPTQADVDGGSQLIRSLQQVPGQVFLPYHGYLPIMAGKQSFGSGMAFFDMQGDSGPVKQWLVEDMRRAIRQQQFDTIVIDAPFSWFSDTWFPEVHDYYVLQRTIFTDPDVFWPVTGMPTRPEWWYIPKPATTQ